MKNRIILLALLIVSLPVIAQVGIGTTTPNSTLDVRGALSLNFRTFTGDISITETDNTLLFKGTADATVILPSAATCIGRSYHIKNGSTTDPLPVVAVTTVNDETIDGGSSYVLNEAYEAVSVISDGTNWVVGSRHFIGSVFNGWNYNGNELTTEKFIGTLNEYDLPFVTEGTERMRLNTIGRLGLGTTNPMTEMHIQSPTVSSTITNTYVQGLTITGGGIWGFGGPGFYLENPDNPSNKKLFKLNFTANGGADSYINFQAVSDNGASNVNANVLAVMHSGRVGVGTATFNGSNPEKFLVDAGTTASINVMAARGSINNRLLMSVQNYSAAASSASELVAMANNGTETTNNVRLGITSNTFANSTIYGTANTPFLFSTVNDFMIGNGAAGKDLVFFTGGVTPASERMRINATGLIPSTDNSYSLGTTSRRWSEVWSVNGTIQTSDARLKEHITDMQYGLNEIMKLRPVTYRWKQDPSMLKVGLIAQEVQQVVPEVVVGNAQSDTLGMNYAELVPVLIKSVQELKKEIEDLKKELETIKAKQK